MSSLRCSQHLAIPNGVFMRSGDVGRRLDPDIPAAAP
ncbi:hypothetical protein PI125_g11464 [Phytophthora idaei]|nr:hypothetical protein PI125_g11464 [Phytophthora idaei]